MWIFSKYGFFSIVKGNGESIQVRARKRKDLVNLLIASNLFKHPIRDDLGTDYAYRVFVSKEQLADVMLALGDSLDYRNFKNMIHNTPDQVDKLPILHHLWADMFHYQGEHKESHAFSGEDCFAAQER